MTNRIKKNRISALCIGLLLALATIIGLLGAPLKTASADAGPDNHTLKFKQIATGSDFAIALSYDNDLYAWSLLDETNGGHAEGLLNDTSGMPVGTVKTLGQYYPMKPVKLDVKFTGIRYTNNSASPIPAVGDAVSGDGTYYGHTTTDPDSIVQIASTSTTAAFLTKKGLVYVWGAELEENVHEGSSYSTTNLLLRSSSGTHTVGAYWGEGHAFIPAIIDYSATSAFLPISSLVTVNTGSYAKSVQSIEGSANNYIVRYTSGNENTLTYVWGRMGYYYSNDYDFSDSQGHGNGRTSFFLDDNGSVTSTMTYLGDDNVYYMTNSGGNYSIKVMGRNFAVIGDEIAVNENGVVSGGVVNTLLPSTNETLFAGNTTANSADSWLTIPGAVTNKFVNFKTGLSVASGSIAPGSETLFDFKDSNGNTPTGLGNIRRSAFSAASGYGYMLIGGKLYFWGDNSLGQNGGIADNNYNPVAASGNLTGENYVQVVAGHRSLGRSLVEGFEANGSSPTLSKGYPEKWASYDKDVTVGGEEPEEGEDEGVETYADGDTYTGVLKSQYVEGNSFISAVLDDSCAVTAFGAYNGTVIPATSLSSAFISCGVRTGSNSANRVVKLFSGYGNNLFALSSLGKIYRITYNGSEFVCKLYDDFYYYDNANLKKYDNWTIGSEQTDVRFRTHSDGEERTGYFTDNSSVTVGLTDSTANGESAAVTHKNVVGSNRSGDAYRMILPITQAGEAAGSKLITLPTGINSADTSLKGLSESSVAENFGRMEFYWSDTPNYPIPDETVERYFTIRYNYTRATGDAPADITFTVIPKQSTVRKSIIIKYWVGRYDAVGNFDVVGNESAGADSFTFYDFKQASVSITIDDTQMAPVYTAQLSENDTNSSIPLLDPNNPYNRNYSVAAMNVSAGFDAVIAKLSELLPNNMFDSDWASNELLKAVTATDAGFPAKSKIEKGKLLYYNENAARDYADTYKWFADDRDGDIITIDNPTPGANREWFSFAVNNVSVKMSYGENITLSEDTVAVLKNWFERTEENGKVLRFDNKYGLTMTVSDTGITFGYQVLTITALKSMDRYLEYGQVDEVPVVSKPITKVGGNSMRDNALEIRLRFTGSNGDSDTVELLNGANRTNRAVEVFTQSSLIFKTADENNVSTFEYYGKEGDANVYQYKNSRGESLITLRPDVEGTGTFTTNTTNINKYTVNLSSLFNDSSNIFITYGDELTGGYDKLKDTFVKGNAVNAIELSEVRRDTFTVLAKHAVSEYEFTIQIRRFMPGSANSVFSLGSEDAEIAYIKFRVTVQFNADTSFTVKNAAKTDPDYGTINSATTFMLSERLTVPESVYGLTGDALKVEASSSNTSVLTVSVGAGKDSLLLSPKASGSAWVFYTVMLYDYVVTDSFRVDVNTLYSMTSRVKVVEEERVYFSDLSSYIIGENKDLEGKTLTLALDEDGNPLYRFETTTGKEVVDSANEWTVIDSIPFLKSVYVDPTPKVEDKKYIGFIMGSFNSNSDVPTVRTVVTFIDDNGIKYDVAFRILPASQTLIDKDSEQGTELTIEINKKNQTVTVLNRAEDKQDNNYPRYYEGSVRIPVAFLQDLMNGAKQGNNAYSISSVRATNADGSVYYTKYIAVSKHDKDVVITPLYPTELLDSDVCNIQVSLRDNEDLSDVTLLNFSIRVTGIDITLEKEQYQTIIIATFFCILGLLIIVFFIRMGLYWKKKAEQRRIVKKNQTLIKMRDKMHNKTEAVSKEQLVRTKLKMEDPKYARMFNEMRQSKEAETGIVLENSTVAQKADAKDKASKAAKKKKGGKKSLEELQAELAAKREAVQRMQMGDFSEAPVTDPAMGAEMPVFDAGAGAPFGDMTPEQLEEQLRQSLGDDILFEPVDGDGNTGI